MTLRYSFRLYGPRSRLQICQMKPASSVCVRAFMLLPEAVPRSLGVTVRRGLACSLATPTR